MPPCIEAVEQGEVSSWLFLSYAQMPPPWEDHQQAPRGRRTRATPGGGRATPGVGRSLIKPSRHCLHVVGSRVGLDHSSIGTLPQMLWFDGPFLFIPLRKSMSRSTFWCILSCICAYVLHNDNLPNTYGTWLVVFKFVNFSLFYVLVGS
jgi:hypothetical protein